MAMSNVTRVVSRVHTTFVVSQCRQRFFYSTSMDAKGRFYTKKHEWLTVNDGIGTVGISHYAQDALGEVVFAQLPEVGKVVSAGEECAALESVKAASEVYSPVSGTIIETNTKVESTPSLINKDCYGSGWLFRVKISEPTELFTLMNNKTYEEYLEKTH